MEGGGVGIASRKVQRDGARGNMFTETMGAEGHTRATYGGSGRLRQDYSRGREVTVSRPKSGYWQDYDWGGALAGGQVISGVLREYRGIHRSSG